MEAVRPFWLPEADMAPSGWLERHEESRRLEWMVRDTRIPVSLARLAKELCSLRSSLEMLRWVYPPHSEGMHRFCEELRGTDVGPGNEKSRNGLARLVRNGLERIDWREQDFFEMMLDYFGGGGGALGDPALAEELRFLEELRLSERKSFDRGVQGFISEARSSFMGLKWGCAHLSQAAPRRTLLDEEGVLELLKVLHLLLGLEDDPTVEVGSSERDDWVETWERIHGKAQERWRRMGLTVPLKPFEKASLFLLEALPLNKTGHAGFVRYLVEREDGYRRILASCYAPWEEQRRKLEEEVARYNRLPEHAGRNVAYEESEWRWLMFAILLRPDVVAAIADRERHKDIYWVLSGLGSKAYLPRTLHEVQNIFGYVTPEAFDQVVRNLGLDPVDVIRVIAGFKQYSADPGGDILIYVCKGTACFLRGQPDLSRRLAAEIQAEEGEVGRHGIQFIEMDCFGVCHLAPVVKTRDVFLGNRLPDDVPVLVEQLLKGPSYENRALFLDRIRRMLAPGWESNRLEELKILEVIEDPAAGPAGPDAAPDSGLPRAVAAGGNLLIDSRGEVFACGNGLRHPLGRLLTDALPYSCPSPGGGRDWGGVILDEVGQVSAVMGFHRPLLRDDLAGSIKPRATVADGDVWVEREAGPVRLGSFTANAIMVEAPDGAMSLVRLSGPPNKAMPEKERGIAAGASGVDGVERPEFLRFQDRLVLGFAGDVDPDEITSYMARGGYEAVHRVLGRRDEPAWEPRDIIIELAGARLRGRGGAGFPADRKWDGVRLARCIVHEEDENKDPIKVVVANGDEGDPGAFMDRTLIQERPHQVIEGMILSAIAVGARYGVIYVRKEYEDAVRRLEHALFQARRKGFLGRDIFGVPGLHFDLDIRLGAGAFVAGEKRAIMRAIEGEPAEPTLNAISNTLRGLWGKPTLLNNVETFANVPLILQRGGEWYARQGTERSGGSKIFSVAGIVSQTGLVEVRFGRTLRDIISICGGIQQGKILAGVQIGGPSGAILSLTGVRAYLLHTPLDFDTFDRVGAMLGSGGLVFLGEDDDVVRLARHFTDWLAEESCGQCPPCLQGTMSLGRTLDAVLNGEALSGHIHALWAKSDTIKAGSQCGLGMTASNPVTSALRFFPHAFLHYLLANPRVDRVELFKGLEALRLLTREPVERIVARRRQVVGFSLTLKRHLLKHVVQEIQRLDQYRPVHARRTARFMELLQLEPHEVGRWDVTVEAGEDGMRRPKAAVV
jgi:NADH:ubiquinone oxidoreductase subunit F (NADH-binding)/NADH:ubiquinone oxidoreductase subunit E